MPRTYTHTHTSADRTISATSTYESHNSRGVEFLPGAKETPTKALEFLEFFLRDRYVVAEVSDSTVKVERRETFEEGLFINQTTTFRGTSEDMRAIVERAKRSQLLDTILETSDELDPTEEVGWDSPPAKP